MLAWIQPDEYIFRRVTGTTYLLMAVTGLGYLALMWSTVVLLGGFVTLLHKKDFWCVTVISMTQAARIIEANILENLCAHCDLDKQWVKETLLPKVLAEILSRKRGTPENKVSPPSNEENQQTDSPPGDEENQQNSAPRNDEETNNISRQQQDIEIQETSATTDQNKSSDGGNELQSTTTKLTREAFLSLAIVILDKLVSADDFHNAVQKEGIGPAAFVGKIKTIVEDNCQGNAESLRIVKLCCRIAEPMMKRDQYAQHFRNTGFVELVSNASKNMSNLESCMLLAETDFGLKKTVRPTLSDLKNRALHLVG